jgi:hypothetical protein
VNGVVSLRTLAGAFVLGDLVVLAVLMLLLLRRRGTGPDGAERLLGWAVRRLPAARAEWGLAMVAELAHIDGAATRWRFVLGCLRVVALPPQTTAGSSTMTGAALLAVLAGGVAVYRSVPAAHAFAAIFTALAGIAVLVASFRPDLAVRSPGGIGMRGFVLVGVPACIAVVLVGIGQYPEAGDDPLHLYTLVFALVLAAYAWIALFPPAPLRPAGGRVATRWALLAGLLAAGLWVLGSVAGDRAWNPAIAPVAFLAAQSVPAFAAAGSQRTAARGAALGLWTGLVAGVAFCVGLLAATYVSIGAYAAVPSLVADFRASGQASLGSYVVSDNLGAAVVMLVMLPAIGLAAGAGGGAAAGTLLSRRAEPAS